MKNLLVCLFIFIVCNASIFPQQRRADQYYIEDSEHIFWTKYPNPFAPPTILNDYSKGKYCGFNTFHCDLSDTVLVVYKNSADIIVYSAKVISKNPPIFRYCIWIGGSQISPMELPEYYYHGKIADVLKIVLVVNGRQKCFIKTLINDKKYYWIE